MRQLLTQSERRPEDALVRHELTHYLLTWRKCIIKRIIAMTVILPHTVLPNASAATLLPSERHPVAARPVLPAPLLPELSKLLARLPVQDDADVLRKSLFHAGTHFNPDLLTSEAERRARLEGVRGKTVVIHDRTMDLLWLNRELQATRPGAPRFEDCCTVIDSFVLARAVPSERRRNGLDALLEWYGLGARGGHHDAYGDAALLSRVFFELWWDLDEWLYGE